MGQMLVAAQTICRTFTASSCGPTSAVASDGSAFDMPFPDKRSDPPAMAAAPNRAR
ncbi:Uncharacterised protein [Mycolicibacterium smegmatis]|uniref:Uncharacterized protein n=1 Tax=Mycolicibacterium smegmatis TaxID=1772 RepID=A0A653FKC0_MYCSM|nr:Uncharacterised protein [Mycolicibacterium smegmatis]VTP10088.1 hypothetical protein BIN_B_04427 [Mycolicibacterium smegmatis]